MIFVTVGASRFPFDRLVAAAEPIAIAGEAVVVQSGTSRARAQHATCFDFLPFDDLEAYVRSARVVVAHAGIGSVALCLSHSQRPVILPRLTTLSEAIDDHQLAFAYKLAELDLITLVHNVGELTAAVAAPRPTPAPTGLSPALAAELVSYISRYAVRDPVSVKSSGR